MAGIDFVPHGTTITFGGDTVGGLLRIGLPDRARGMVETTDTASGGDREYIKGLREGGILRLTCKELHDDAGQTGMRADYEAAMGTAAEAVVITFPGTADDGAEAQTISFDAHCQNVSGDEWDLQGDQVAVTSFTLKVTGAVTFASA